MIRKILVIGMSLIILTCSSNDKQLRDLEFEEYSLVVKELPELKQRIKKLVNGSYTKIEQVLIESDPTLSPVIDGLLYSFFGDSDNGTQVYILIDKANENILLGYYCSEEELVKVYEEKKGVTKNPEFEQWLVGE